MLPLIFLHTQNINVILFLLTHVLALEPFEPHGEAIMKIVFALPAQKMNSDALSAKGD